MDKNLPKSTDYNERYSYESLGNLEFFPYVFSEALRYEPSFPVSSQIYLKQSAKLGDIDFRAHDTLCVHIWGLHHHPDQWQDPHSFRPERFDPLSPLYLTPTGKKRHPFAYMPFLAGKRICFGKTFAEIAAKTVTCMLVGAAEMRFVEAKYQEEFPLFNVLVNYDK